MSNYNHPALKIVRDDLTNLEAIERVAAQLLAPERLAEDPVFKAYCELSGIGPNNDYDGSRSCALRLKREWEYNVLFPANQVLIVRAASLV